MTTLDRSRILLSAQRALLGAILPTVRAVDISWNDVQIRIRFTLESSGDSDIQEIMYGVEAEIEGDFLPDVRVSSETKVLPIGNLIEEFNKLDLNQACTD